MQECLNLLFESTRNAGIAIGTALKNILKS